MKVYEFNLRALMDLVTTNYAVGFNPANPSATTTLTSVDPVYKDAAEFIDFGKHIDFLINLGDIKPFPFSDLRLEGGVLYFPVSTGTKKIRFGSTLYDIDEGHFMIDTTRAATESLVICDYNKYLGRGMSRDEKDDLAFILNLYRRGRSPLMELDILGSADIATMAAGLRRTTDGREINAYVEQMQRISKMFSSASPIIDATDLPVDLSTLPRVAPLLSILHKFLDTAGFVGGNMNPSAEYNADLYQEWNTDILVPLSPVNINEFMIDMGAEMIYVFQFIANHPGLINRSEATGGLKLSVDGKPAPGAVGITRARNESLLKMANSLTDFRLAPTDLVSSAITLRGTEVKNLKSLSDLAEVSFTDSLVAEMYKEGQRENGNPDGDSKILNAIQSAVRGATDGSVFGQSTPNDMLMTFDVANTGLMPLDTIFESTQNVHLNMSKAGAGYSNLINRSGIHDNSDLDAATSMLVQFEEELYRGAEYSLYQLDHSGPGNYYKKTDLRNVTISTVSDSSFSRQSTVGLYTQDLEQGTILNKYFSQHNAFRYESLVDGKDTGAINPLARSIGALKDQSSSYVNNTGDLVRLANEMTSKSKGEWYKMDFDVVRGSRVAVEKVIARFIKGMK